MLYKDTREFTRPKEDLEPLRSWLRGEAGMEALREWLKREWGTAESGILEVIT
jgi:hypothetical protein